MKNEKELSKDEKTNHPVSARMYGGRKDNSASLENVDILCVDHLSIEEMGRQVKEWCDDCIDNFEK